MKTSQRPTVREATESHRQEDTVYEHPAYGVVRISNPHGHKVLFGSDTVHDDYIELEIAPAKLKRGLSTDWIHGDSRSIVSVAMSHAQFVSMIQSSGKGSGTPCTIQYAPAEFNKTTKGVPNIEPISSKIDLIKGEINSDVKKAIEMAQLALNKLEEAVEAKKGVTILRPLLATAKRKVEQLPGNLNFALKCAEETIDKAVHDAHMDIEAGVESKLRRIGLEALEVQSDNDKVPLIIDVEKLRGNLNID